MTTMLNSVCQACGDVGISGALVVCWRCKRSAEHSYCLNRYRMVPYENFQWSCEQCERTSENLIVKNGLIKRFENANLLGQNFKRQGLENCSSNAHASKSKKHVVESLRSGIRTKINMPVTSSLEVKSTKCDTSREVCGAETTHPQMKNHNENAQVLKLNNIIQGKKIVNKKNKVSVMHGQDISALASRACNFHEPEKDINVRTGAFSVCKSKSFNITVSSDSETRHDAADARTKEMECLKDDGEPCNEKHGDSFATADVDDINGDGIGCSSDVPNKRDNKAKASSNKLQDGRDMENFGSCAAVMIVPGDSGLQPSVQKLASCSSYPTRNENCIPASGTIVDNFTSRRRKKMILEDEEMCDECPMSVRSGQHNINALTCKTFDFHKPHKAVDVDVITGACFTCKPKSSDIRFSPESQTRHEVSDAGRKNKDSLIVEGEQCDEKHDVSVASVYVDDISSDRTGYSSDMANKKDNKVTKSSNQLQDGCDLENVASHAAMSIVPGNRNLQPSVQERASCSPTGNDNCTSASGTMGDNITFLRRRKRMILEDDEMCDECPTPVGSGRDYNNQETTSGNNSNIRMSLLLNDGNGHGTYKFPDGRTCVFSNINSVLNSARHHNKPGPRVVRVYETFDGKKELEVLECTHGDRHDPVTAIKTLGSDEAYANNMDNEKVHLFSEEKTSKKRKLVIVADNNNSNSCEKVEDSLSHDSTCDKAEDPLNIVSQNLREQTFDDVFPGENDPKLDLPPAKEENSLSHGNTCDKAEDPLNTDSQNLREQTDDDVFPGEEDPILNLPPEKEEPGNKMMLDPSYFGVDSRNNTKMVSNQALELLATQFPADVEQVCNAPILPIFTPTWRGCLAVARKDQRMLCNSVKAHISDGACAKVHSTSRMLPHTLEFEMCPRLKSWPNTFNDLPPTPYDIALFFFPDGDRSSYDKLLIDAIESDLALKATLENVELVVYPSLLLPEAYHRHEQKFYLWGIFSRKQDPISIISLGKDERRQGSDILPHKLCNTITAVMGVNNDVDDHICLSMSEKPPVNTADAESPSEGSLPHGQQIKQDELSAESADREEDDHVVLVANKDGQLSVISPSEKCETPAENGDYNAQTKMEIDSCLQLRQSELNKLLATIADILHLGSFGQEKNAAAVDGSCSRDLQKDQLDPIPQFEDESKSPDSLHQHGQSMNASLSMSAKHARSSPEVTELIDESPEMDNNGNKIDHPPHAPPAELDELQSEADSKHSSAFPGEEMNASSSNNFTKVLLERVAQLENEIKLLRDQKKSTHASIPHFGNVRQTKVQKEAVKGTKVQHEAGNPHLLTPSAKGLLYEFSVLCKKTDPDGFWNLMFSRWGSAKTLLEKRLPKLLLSCIDPARFVLDVLSHAFPPFKKDVSIASEGPCLLMLDCLLEATAPSSTSGFLPPNIATFKNKGLARDMANSWKHSALGKNRWEMGDPVPPHAHVFLALVSAFDVVKEHERELYVRIVLGLAWKKGMSRLALQVGLDGEELVQELLARNSSGLALYFVYDFGLARKFPPIELMKEFLEKTNRTPHKLVKALNLTLNSARVFGLDSLGLPVDSMSQRIRKLQSILQSVRDREMNVDDSIVNKIMMFRNALVKKLENLEQKHPTLDLAPFVPSTNHIAAVNMTGKNNKKPAMMREMIVKPGSGGANQQPPRHEPKQENDSWHGLKASIKESPEQDFIGKSSWQPGQDARRNENWHPRTGGGRIANVNVTAGGTLPLEGSPKSRCIYPKKRHFKGKKGFGHRDVENGAFQYNRERVVGKKPWTCGKQSRGTSLRGHGDRAVGLDVEWEEQHLTRVCNRDRLPASSRKIDFAGQEGWDDDKLEERHRPRVWDRDHQPLHAASHREDSAGQQAWDNKEMDRDHRPLHAASRKRKYAGCEAWDDNEQDRGHPPPHAAIHKTDYAGWGAWDSPTSHLDANCRPPSDFPHRPSPLSGFDDLDQPVPRLVADWD